MQSYKHKQETYGIWKENIEIVCVCVCVCVHARVCVSVCVLTCVYSFHNKVYEYT